MDKEYLIHNIEVTDNPNDGHVTMDIALSDITSGGDITATIGIGLFVNGELDKAESNEDVSLTGAGGGGEISNANITIIPKLNGADIPGTIDSLILQLLDLQFSDYTLNGGEFAYSDEQVEMPIKVPYTNYADIQKIGFSIDGGAVYFWAATEPINIEGDAAYNGGLIRITGDCTITIPVNED